MPDTCLLKNNNIKLLLEYSSSSRVDEEVFIIQIVQDYYEALLCALFNKLSVLDCQSINNMYYLCIKSNEVCLSLMYAWMLSMMFKCETHCRV